MNQKKFDPTKPVQTRDGNPARIVCTDATVHRPIIALVTSYEGNIHAQTYTLSGSVINGCEDRPDDLINIPEKRFVNIWERDGRCCVSYTPYATAEKAKEVNKRCGYKYIAIAVEVEV